ncbi:MAG: heat-inducible transcriptional repressor HrcA [Thermomicrobium sp.]|nr:heat-inducible transcriptional repressor HrcA [Thermomicrobium sp.]
MLRHVVEEYLHSGRAVGSRALLERVTLGVSPATVRNDMSVLEALDFLTQPHTSAGRVPTEQGLRYYVRYLMEESELTPEEQLMIRHQFRQVEQQVPSWLKLAASVLAETSGSVGLVTPPRARVERLRHFEAISLRPRVVLLVVVTQSGAVHQTLLDLSVPLEQEELSALSRALNPELRWLDRHAIERRASSAAPLTAQVLRHIADALRFVEEQQRSELYAEGVEYVIRQPEFAQAQLTQVLLEVLRGGMLLTWLLPRLDPQEGVRVLIGSELVVRELRPFSLVLSAYRSGTDVTGWLGVLGLQRMAYARAIAGVRFLSSVISELMSELSGEPEREGGR